jgi:hypothetical protein
MRAPSNDLARHLKSREPDIRDLVLATRALVLDEAAPSHEITYEAHRALTVSFSFSPSVQAGFCHVAVHPKHITLGFQRGTTLPDPEHKLLGNGMLIRHLKLTSMNDLKAPHVRGFVKAAAAAAVARHNELETMAAI